jgi:hypothetical protein
MQKKIGSEDLNSEDMKVKMQLLKENNRDLESQLEKERKRF